eukprot:11660814-Ditylum_brightwellii.AAC.1
MRHILFLHCLQKEKTVINLVNKESSNSDSNSTDLSAFEANSLKRTKKVQTEKSTKKDYTEKPATEKAKHLWQRRHSRGRKFLTLAPTRSPTQRPLCVASCNIRCNREKNTRQKEFSSCSLCAWSMNLLSRLRKIERNKEIAIIKISL